MNGDLLFNGNEKKIYATDSEDIVQIHYTDVITCFNQVKRARIQQKGIYTNKISALLFDYLTAHGIRNHFIRLEGERDQLCHRITVIPIEVDVHNIAAGTMASLLGLKEGQVLANAVIDLRYNVPRLNKPLINRSRATALGLMSAEEANNLCEVAAEVNRLLTERFDRAGILLVDMKMEFGRAADGTLIVSDELSPDRFRLWDKETKAPLDKDRFRHDLGNITAAYKEVYDRLIQSQS